MKKLFAALALAALAVSCSPPAAEKAPEPAAISSLAAEADDATRKALVAALTPVVEKDLAQDVTLGVEIARSMGEWGWVSGRAEAPDGSAIDIAKTHYAEQAREGMFDGPAVNALLERKNGAWKVVAFDIGSTDVAWAAWPQKYRAPPEVMGFETSEAPTP